MSGYTCTNYGCSNPVENWDTGLCASCSHAQRKAERQASKVKIVTPIKKITTKRAAQNQEYLKLRKEYLEAYPACEVEDCHNKSKELHHKKGRDGDLLTNTDYFMGVCPSCHYRITTDSAWATSKGYSYSRIAKQ
jgi:hypothetical protein